MFSSRLFFMATHTPGKKNKDARGGRLFEAVARELYVRNAELAVRNKTLSLLHRLDAVAMASLETNRMTGNIARILIDEFHFDIAAIGVVDKTHRRLSWLAMECLKMNPAVCRVDARTRPIALTRTNNLAVQSVKQRRRITTRSLADVLVPAFSASSVAAHQTANRIRSVILYPIQTDAGVLGVMMIGLNRKSRDLTRHEQETIDGLLSLVTIAIQKAQMYTSLKEATEALTRANKKLTELDALKTEFLSIASHQLRTPLAVIKGYAGMMEQGMLGRMNERQRGALAKVSTSTQELIALVQHLLDISRIETGRLVVNLAPVDMVRIAQDVTEFLRPRALEKGLPIHVSAHGPIWARADEEKVKEIVMNYLDNAIKYADRGRVSIRVAREARVVHVAVHDVGHGLTAADQAHLFEKFTRGSASKHTKVSTGLGLYVCRRLAEAMGGRVWAQSAGRGKGSTFHLELPATSGAKTVRPFRR
jgi:signal transduction histidine kinase